MGLCAWAQNQQPRESVRAFMRPKLSHSQNLLEGLTLEQFEVIKKEAQALSLLSREAEWNVLQTEDYLHYSSEFRRAADAIRDAAARKNLDGAALAYVEMTMKCINCHKYVRGVRTADGNQKPPTRRAR
jgi:hypothetical protein